jgi:outer membrane murein-binding lipoprotein Lpp
MKKMILLAILAAFILTGCASSAKPAQQGYCPPDLANQSILALDRQMNKYMDVEDLANMTGRGNLHTVMLEMLRVKWDTEDLDVPECLLQARDHLALSIDMNLDGYYKFMSEKSDKDVQKAFEDSAKEFQLYNIEIIVITECLPDCKPKE